MIDSHDLWIVVMCLLVALEKFLHMEGNLIEFSAAGQRNPPGHVFLWIIDPTTQFIINIIFESVVMILLMDMEGGKICDLGSCFFCSGERPELEKHEIKI